MSCILTCVHMLSKCAQMRQPCHPPCHPTRPHKQAHAHIYANKHAYRHTRPNPIAPRFSQTDLHATRFEARLQPAVPVALSDWCAPIARHWISCSYVTVHEHARTHTHTHTDRCITGSQRASASIPMTTREVFDGVSAIAARLSALVSARGERSPQLLGARWLARKCAPCATKARAGPRNKMMIMLATAFAVASMHCGPRSLCQGAQGRGQGDHGEG